MPAALRLRTVLWSALLVSTAGSCLVLQDNEVVGVENLSVLSHISPLEFTRKPSAGSPRCSNDGMAFEAQLFDLDVTQTLWRRIFINGKPPDNNGAAPVEPLEPPSDTRLLNDLCVPGEAFNAPCNQVELLVSSDLYKLRTAESMAVVGSPDGGVVVVPTIDPAIARITWFVLGPADSDFGPATPSDCERLLLDDGGVGK